MLYVHASTTRADGSKDTFYTTACESKDSPLWWQEKGLSYTATGYGSRIPTRTMVRFNGRWRRVYCRVYSNAGTCYIGKRLSAACMAHGLSPVLTLSATTPLWCRGMNITPRLFQPMGQFFVWNSKGIRRLAQWNPQLQLWVDIKRLPDNHTPMV